MKIISIVGARPQFIKAVFLSKELRKKFNEVIVHTGQHYDFQMSRTFFNQLKIPKPKYNLGIGSDKHGIQTGKMIIGLENILIHEKPQLVIIFGDTNSTLAGAIVASKLQIPIAHIEAGMRSFDRSMPEEINRVVADHLTTLYFCSTTTSVKNLKKEGIDKNVFLVGDIMFDTFLKILPRANKESQIIKKLKLKPQHYSLLTIHRASNTDSKNNLSLIIKALIKSQEKIVFPVHPRTIKYLKKYRLFNAIKKSGNILLTDPVNYIDMIKLEQESRIILTDSGGVQKEAYFLKKPCITLRNETEWVETVKDGWNKVTGVVPSKILKYLKKFPLPAKQNFHYGKGNSAVIITKKINNYFTR